MDTTFATTLQLCLFIPPSLSLPLPPPFSLCVHVLWVWKHVEVRGQYHCLPHLLSTLFLTQNLSSELEFIDSVRSFFFPQQTSGNLVFPVLALQASTMSDFYMSAGLRFSCLHSWAIAPASLTEHLFIPSESVGIHSWVNGTLKCIWYDLDNTVLGTHK